MLLLATYSTCEAQRDTILLGDSTKIYKEIQQYSKKSKFGSFLFGKIVKNQNQPIKKPIAKSKRKTYVNLSCKIIRSIKIHVLDPFGYSIKDTTIVPHSTFQKLGNKVHKCSTNLAIRNFLLFHSGDEFDPYRIEESERLIRQASIFNDVSITPVCKKGEDSLDIIIWILDKWSITGNITANPNRARINITEKNILGLGHEFSNTFEYNKDFHLQAYSGIYSINRIGNTFINAKISAVDQSDGSERRGLEVERPFYSPITKWAGGIAVGQSVINDAYYLKSIDSIAGNNGIKYNDLDFFIARSFKLNQNGVNWNNQVTYKNLITSVRSLSNRIINSGTLGDSLGIYKSRDYLMGMVALSVINYERENYLFKFGETEDIPVGSFYGIIAAIDHKNNSKYLGFRIGSAFRYSMGYLSILFEGGKYYDYGYTNPTILNTEITYYSPLLSIGNWKIRQFIKPRLTLGWNETLNKSLVLNDDGGIQGFSDNKLFGLNRTSIYLQTQAYAPWNLFGFKFGPILYFSAGAISDNQSQLLKGTIYSSVGVGILFKNEMLVWNAFEVSISIYPNVPESNNRYKVNAFRSVDFQLNNLNIDKPVFVDFK